MFPLAVLVLWFRSKDLKLPSGMEESGLFREILKVSLFIFNKLFKNRMSFSGEKVRGYLRTLNDKRDIENLLPGKRHPVLKQLVEYKKRNF